MIPEEKLDIYILYAVRILAVAGCLVALIILADYIFPGQKVEELVVWKATEVSSSHRSGHDSYRIETPRRYFYCKSDFFTKLHQADTVTLQLSPFFSAVDSYACNRFMPEAETYSLRYVGGLVLPLLMWIVAFLSWKFKNNVLYFLVFILSILNFISLIMLI